MPLPLNLQATGPDPLVEARNKLLAAKAGMANLTGSVGALSIVTDAIDTALADVANAYAQMQHLKAVAASAGDASAANPLQGELDTCKANLTKLQSQLQAAPKDAKGQLLAPGAYVTMSAAGGMALGAAILGGLGGYWFRGKSGSKSLGHAGEPKALAEEGESQAQEKRKKR